MLATRISEDERLSRRHRRRQKALVARNGAPSLRCGHPINRTLGRFNLAGARGLRDCMTRVTRHDGRILGCGLKASHQRRCAATSRLLNSMDSRPSLGSEWRGGLTGDLSARLRFDIKLYVHTILPVNKVILLTRENGLGRAWYSIPLFD